MLENEWRYVVLFLLILIPSVVNLSVSLYNRNMPELFGMPFFYWFQTLWLVCCSGFYMGFAYLMGDSREGRGRGGADSKK
jgi:hypothetical protein